jgi:hypothetical protein
VSIVRVRQSPGGTDQYGDPIPSTETRTTLADAFTAPRTSDDIDARGRTGVIVGLTLFATYGTDITHSDFFEVDGELYRIEGEPGKWKNPLTGWEAGISVALERAQG